MQQQIFFYLRGSILLVEETGVPKENHWPAASHWQTLSHNMLYALHLSWVGSELPTLMAIGTDCIDSCKSNYHVITTVSSGSNYK